MLPTVVWLVGSAVVSLSGCDRSPAGQALVAVSQGRCADLGFAEAAVPCWTESAVESARDGQASAALAACAEVAPGLWRDECNFRCGEALGLTGDLAAAATSCARAGRYQDFCVLHLAWWARPFPIVLSPADGGALAAVEAQDALLLPLATGLKDDALSMLRTSVWFDLYLGSGSANPEAARQADLPEARTAWAHEAVRLASNQTDDQLLAVWSGSAGSPTGDSQPPRCWRGQIEDPLRVAELGSVQRTALVHGGQRLVGQTVTDDLRIALLQARAFQGSLHSEALREVLSSGSAELQWTAARLLARLVGPADPTVSALLSGTDDRLRASAQAGLRAGVSEWSASERCR